MNYLNTLPVELWTEIILLSAPFVNVPPDPFTHLSSLHRSTYASDTAKAMQLCRLSLLRVCRSFYCLVEPLLYKEVVLLGERQVQCLKDIANTKLIGDKPCIYHTTSIFIYPGAISTLTNPAPIQDWFPNLVTMVAYEGGQRLFSMWSINNGSRLLTYTTIYPIDNNGYIRHCPDGLRNASLGHSIQQSNDPASFANLRAVSMNRRAIPIFRDLAMPSLRHLYIETGGLDYWTQHIRALTEKNGANLVELEYAVSPRRARNADFPDPLFAACPKLKVLKFNPLTMLPKRTNAEDIGIPHHSLSDLVMMVTSGYDVSGMMSDIVSLIEGHSKWFNRTRFPNLSRVTFILERRYNPNGFGASISHLFPNIEISVIH